MPKSVHQMRTGAAKLSRLSNKLLTKAARALLEAVEINQHREARFEAITESEAERFDPEWSIDLRVLADKLRDLPLERYINQPQADLCTEVAAFLDMFFDAPVDEESSEISSAGVLEKVDDPPELSGDKTHDLVSSALAKAEANRDQRIQTQSEET